MELSFLKNTKNKQGGGGPVPTVHASTQDGKGSMDDSLIDHVADEFFHAIEVKDKRLLKDALGALIQYIQDEDTKQDEGAES